MYLWTVMRSAGQRGGCSTWPGQPRQSPYDRSWSMCVARRVPHCKLTAAATCRRQTRLGCTHLPNMTAPDHGGTWRWSSLVDWKPVKLMQHQDVVELPSSCHDTLHSGQSAVSSEGCHRSHTADCCSNRDGCWRMHAPVSLQPPKSGKIWTSVASVVETVTTSVMRRRGQPWWAGRRWWHQSRALRMTAWWPQALCLHYNEIFTKKIIST